MKHTKLFAAIAAGLALLASSCSNLSTGSVSDDDSSTTVNTRTLNIAVTNKDEVVSSMDTSSSSSGRAASPSGARTILPDSFTSDKITLYLSGYATNGSTFGPQKISATWDTADSKVGTIAIPAAAYSWEFALYATDGEVTLSGTYATDVETLESAAVLRGYSSMDMANGDTAKFTLSPDGLKKVAAVSMKLYLEDWGDSIPEGYSATAGIYSIITGEAVNDSAGTTTVKELTTDISGKTTGTTAFGTAADSATAYTLDNEMDPGTYLFKVTFSKANKKFTWSDVLIVLPGKTLDNTVGIPNMIGKAPTKPADFKAAYIKDSEDASVEYYITEFEWTRGSKNEDYYEIDVVELSDSTTSLPASDTDWTSAGTSTTYGKNFSSEPNAVKGSLLSGNTSVQMRLELGKRYWARIRAINDAGNSDYVYVTLSATTNGTEFTSDTINRFRIKYNLNNGKLKGTVGETTYTGTENIDAAVAYYCQSSDPGNAIFVPDDTNTLTYKPTENSSYSWSYWKYDVDGTATKYDTTANADYPYYKGYANLELSAFYTTDASVEIFDKKDYEILSTWITVDAGTITATSSGGTITIDTSTITADADGKKIITWTFKPVDDTKKITEDFTYSKVTFTVNQGGSYSSTQEAEDVGLTGTTFKQDVTYLNKGSHNVLFQATFGNTTVGYNVTLTIEY